MRFSGASHYTPHVDENVERTRRSGFQAIGYHVRSMSFLDGVASDRIRSLSFLDEVVSDWLWKVSLGASSLLVLSQVSPSYVARGSGAQ